ncbi:unnamed protein product [Somion occarium]|uniref:Uncharacterized protein n=1 Tax=Somion occarium TaxID=3059160 RepID=A0ABP1D8C2_9APHY
MSSGKSPYGTPPTIRSTLFKNPSDSIPPTDELQILQEELKLFREKTLERARRAGEDIRIIEESMRRLREREKGKAKAPSLVKKERAYTPQPSGEDKKPLPLPQNLQRPRPPSVPASGITSGASTPSFETRKSLAQELKNKKKKRAREEMSDLETPPQKMRKTSPALSQHTHPHPPPPKASKHPPIPAKAASGPDFSIPPPVNLLPPRPPIPPPPIPGPSKPTDVMDDFSKSKQPSQVLVTTFYSSIEPWLRPIKEEDIGFLEYTGDETEPFVIPKLGRHYSEVWHDEDVAAYGEPLPGTAAARPRVIAPSTGPLPKWEPSTLMEQDCVTEEHGHGPLNERLVSAIIPMKNDHWKGVKAAEEAMEGRPGTNGAAAQAARDKMNVADLEDRIKNALRYHGIIDEIPDFSEAVDDPIATALRHAQSEMRTVMATNKARRHRLAEIARAKLSYQEFLEDRDYLDKAIANQYAKLQKKDIPKVSKKKKQKAEPNGAAANGGTNSTTIPPPPAALGLVPDEENHLTVPEQLRQLIEARRQWDEIGEKLVQEYHGPGQLVGFPKSSVFEGIDEEVKRQLERLDPPGGFTSGSSSNKGKAKAEA